MKNKYATLDISDSMGFREITRELAKEGHMLTPAKARLILLSVLEKITRHVSQKNGRYISKQKAQEIVQHPDFQNNIAPFIEMAYQKEQR